MVFKEELHTNLIFVARSKSQYGYSNLRRYHSRANWRYWKGMVIKVEEKNTFQKIYDVVKEIPCGQVASYGQVAELAGNRRLAKVVGYALHVNPDPGKIPCHRVVTIDGKVSKAFAFGGENQQVKLLKEEGVIFLANGLVDMEKCQWKKRIF